MNPPRTDCPSTVLKTAATTRHASLSNVVGKGIFWIFGSLFLAFIHRLYTLSSANQPIMSKANKTWNSTRYQNLYRHTSGVYYARLTVNKRKTWRSLKTEILGVARTELSRLLNAERERAELAEPQEKNKGTVSLGEMAAEWLAIVQSDTSTKDSTKKYQRETHAALFRLCPKLEKKDVRKVTEEDCREWGSKHREHFSATRFNAALGALKQVFELAVERGLRLKNPAKKLKRAKVARKELGMILPEPEVFAKWVEEIRKSPSRYGQPCGDMVEFLAYTGLRPDTEAAFVTWRHCDFKANEVVVTGDPENEGTKNRKTRRIPMSGDLRALLERMREARQEEADHTPVLQVLTSRSAMRRAAKIVGMEDITRYDLRHLFATRCLESGVDAATLASWLGHQDGGALVLKTYIHVRNPHSQAAAAKVSF